MSIVLEEKGLYLELPALAETVYFNYYWLRDNCPTAFDEQTRERVFDVCSLAFAPYPASVAKVGEHLQVHWNNEPHISHFPLSWLTEWALAKGRQDPAQLPRTLWYSDAYDSFPRFEFSTLTEDANSQVYWLQALLQNGVALVKGLPDNDAALTQLASLIGSVRASVAGDYFEVKVHQQPVNLSYTAAALEMHTDTPAEELPPGIQFLHCRANSVTGGDSLFMDGVAAASDFRQLHPEAFDLLVNTSVPFFYEHDSFDWRAYQRVIELDDQGDISGVTVSQHMADTFDLPQTYLDDYYPAFISFLKFINQPQYLVRFRLNAGECIVFDNHRVVHGRCSYEAASGSRYLRGCYIDRGELRSRYRTLSRQQIIN